MSAIYSVFLPFMQSIGDVTNFNTAYYGALAGIERAELSLRYKNPWFEWSWWFFWSTSFWPQSDRNLTNFGSLTSQKNWFARRISSRTRTIPVLWEGNVDYLLSVPSSKNYNKLPYFTSEKIFFSLDDTKNPDQYYSTWSNIVHFSGWFFSGNFRLPPKVIEQLEIFWSSTELCSSCDIDGDTVNDDVVINRVLEGSYDGKSFSIIPYIDVFYYSGGHVNYNEDTAIREDLINQTGKFYFWSTYYTKEYSPINEDIYNRYRTWPRRNIIISESEITKLTGATLNDILLWWWQPDLIWAVTDLKLNIWIVNLLRTTDELNFIYPFLEYQFSFPQPVSDTFYTILGNGLVGDYNVKIYIKKSTNDEQSIGDFTVIF
jgi:hypothetical protein